MSDEDAGYTRNHPVAVNLACESCRMTLAGDNVPDVLREMFEECHRHAS